MNRLVALALAMALAGCDAPFWEKQKREDAQVARQRAVRAEEHETWRAEEARRLLALCLDIAKFEKQWANFAEWSFDAPTGACTTTYKKPAAEQRTEKQCASVWLTGEGERAGDAPSDAASTQKQTGYYRCVSDTFSKVWKVQPGRETAP